MALDLVPTPSAPLCPRCGGLLLWHSDFYPREVPSHLAQAHCIFCGMFTDPISELNRKIHADLMRKRRWRRSS
jgi:hypothetical protein